MEHNAHLSDFADLHERVSAWNLNLPAHPETPFETDEIAFFIADTLRSAGIETYHNRRSSSVIGVIHGTQDGPWINLVVRTDPRDFLDPDTVPHLLRRQDKTLERTDHSTALLSVATYLARTRDFAGTVVVLFQSENEDINHPDIHGDNEVLKRFPIEFIFGIPSPVPPHAATYWIQTVRRILGTV